DDFLERKRAPQRAHDGESAHPRVENADRCARSAHGLDPRSGSPRYATGQPPGRSTTAAAKAARVPRRTSAPITVDAELILPKELEESRRLASQLVIEPSNPGEHRFRGVHMGIVDEAPHSARCSLQAPIQCARRIGSVLTRGLSSAELPGP